MSLLAIVLQCLGYIQIPPDWQQKKKKNKSFKKYTKNVLCLLMDLFGYQNERSNQNSAQFRQGQVHPIPRQ
jgi:hypothetical protein